MSAATTARTPRTGATREAPALAAVHGHLLGSVDAAVQPNLVSVWIRGEGRS